MLLLFLVYALVNPNVSSHNLTFLTIFTCVVCLAGSSELAAASWAWTMSVMKAAFFFCILEAAFIDLVINFDLLERSFLFPWSVDYAFELSVWNKCIFTSGENTMFHVVFFAK